MVEDMDAIMSIADQSAHFLARDHKGAPAGLVVGDVAWRASNLGASDQWIDVLTPKIVDAFEMVMEKLHNLDRTADQLTADEVRIPLQTEVLQGWRDTLTKGRG